MHRRLLRCTDSARRRMAVSCLSGWRRRAGGVLIRFAQAGRVACLSGSRRRAGGVLIRFAQAGGWRAYPVCTGGRVACSSGLRRRAGGVLIRFAQAGRAGRLSGSHRRGERGAYPVCAGGASGAAHPVCAGGASGMLVRFAQAGRAARLSGLRRDASRDWPAYRPAGRPCANRIGTRGLCPCGDCQCGDAFVRPTVVTWASLCSTARGRVRCVFAAEPGC